MKVELRPVDEHNWRAVTELRVGHDQERFVAAPAHYLALCRYGTQGWSPLSIYADDELVGFVMWARDPADDSLWIGGLCVDRERQRRGVGRAAMRELIDELRRKPDCRGIALSYDPDNDAARTLYASLGFTETGEKEDDEVVARLAVSGLRSTDVNVDEQARAEADPQAIMSFMTTEHFALQSARAAANAEISARLQLYLTTLSSTIIALALAAQLPGLGTDFRAFALVLLPIVFLLGIVTLGRLNQLELEWRICGQGMSRIRHYFLEVAPEMERYFVMPSTDDPRASLEAIGIEPRSWSTGLFTARAVVTVVNGVVAAAFAGLLASMGRPHAVLVPSLSAATAFVVSAVAVGIVEQRRHTRDVERSPVEFRAPTPGSQSH